MNLNGCFAKINRAREQLEELKEARAECVSSKFLRADVQLESEYYVARIRTLAPLPLRVANIVGDIVHNLRSALDHLACTMVRFSGGEVTRQTQFPITENHERFATIAAAQIKGIKPELLDLVERFQPYHQAPLSHHPLSVIHRLDIEDKHRNLLVAAMLPSSVEFKAEGPENSVYDVVFNSSPPFPLTDGAELLKFKLRSGYFLRDIRLTIGLGADLALVEEAPVHAQPVVLLLHSLSEYLLNDVFLTFSPIIEEH